MKNILNKDFYNKLLTKPEKAIEDLDLVYVNVQDMNIIRLKAAENFCYQLNNKILSKKSEIDRIESLVIPPLGKR